MCDVLEQVTRFLVILLIVSAIRTVKSFRVERDFACLCENGFSFVISEIVLYEKSPLCGAEMREPRTQSIALTREIYIDINIIPRKGYISSRIQFLLFFAEISKET